MIKRTVKTTFQLYQTENSKLKSTFFDLIDGDLETKQTKGLSYLMSLSPDLLKGLLTMDKIKKGLKNSQYKGTIKCDYIKIDAEMLSEGIHKIRRDITLTLYNKSKKVLIIVIEAKNVKVGKDHKIENQLQNYIEPNNFPNEENVPKLLIALTKHEQCFVDLSIISIKWTELIKVLHQATQRAKDPTVSLLLKDYYKFITGVDKDMYFYEKEILSVPAGKTFNEITKYHIHACPVSYNYRDSLFITFRQKGGVMDKLYKIEEIIELDPKEASMVKIVADRETSYKKRLLSYLEERKTGYGFNHEETYRFYILSEKEEISLPHQPHPKINNIGPRYYTLAEMLSGREIVQTESKLEAK